MPIKARKRVRIGPRFAHVALNVTHDGYKSRSYKVGPWSWNTRSRRHRVDLPGPWHWIGERKPASGARKPSAASRPPRNRARPASAGQQPSNLLPAAQSFSVLGSVCVVAFAAGAGLIAAVGGAVFGCVGAGLAVKHVRRERAAGRRGLPFLPLPGTRVTHYSAAPAAAPLPTSSTVPCGCRSGKRCPGVGKCRCAKCRSSRKPATP